VKQQTLKTKDRGLIFHPGLLTIALLMGLIMQTNPAYAIDANQQLFDAIDQHDQAWVEQALQAQADVNVSRPKGLSRETPLLLAVTSGDRDIAEVLIKHGADIVIHHGSLNNVSLLSIAIDQEDFEMVSLLIKYGAAINKKSGFWRNYSPLYRATSHGDLVMAKVLIDAGAKIIPNRWSHVKKVLAAPWNLLQGKVVDLARPPSLLEAAQTSGNEKLYQFLKDRGAR
jgi:hypothetical protein